MTDLDQLRALYATPPTTQPKPGDTVVVDGLGGMFTVESFDGRALFTLRSRYGAMCRAGVLVVRRVERDAP